MKHLYCVVVFVAGENTKTPTSTNNASPKVKNSRAAPPPAAAPVVVETNGGLDDETIRKNREKLFASKTKKTAVKMYC